MPTSVNIQSPTDGLFATSIHSSGHYYLDQYGHPMLMVGASDDTWTNISVADMQTVMATRAAQGFNWQQAIMTASKAIDNASCVDNGYPDWATFDGIVPFYDSSGTTLGTSPSRGDPHQYDVTQPNLAYWYRIDALFQAARVNGITLLVELLGDTVYGQGGANGFYADQGNTKLATFATWFANRYRSYTYHYLWGYDHFTGVWGSADPYLIVMLNATRAVNPRALHCIENNDAIWTTGQTSGTGPDLSSDDTNFSMGGGGAGSLDMNWCYTAEDNSPDILRGYNMAPAFPVFFAEGQYEGAGGSYPSTKNTWSNLLGRKYLWYPMVNGAAGSIYGHDTTWWFGPGYASVLSTTVVGHVGIWKTFLTSLAWWALIPDQGHTFATAGYPTAGYPYPTRFGVNAAVTADGTVGLVYLAANGSVTINMAKMSAAGHSVARWFDPTNGTYTAIGTFPTTGSHTFTSSTNNAAGDPDWVLVLTV